MRQFYYKVGRLLQIATEKEGYEKVTQKKWIRIASNSISLFSPRLICQLLAIFFLELNYKTESIKVQEKKKEVFVLCSRPHKNIKIGTITL